MNTDLLTAAAVDAAGPTALTLPFAVRWLYEKVNGVLRWIRRTTRRIARWQP